ncbi:hypothetical protein CMI37_16435 [Candidatus Pacearchaeota archaeon]|nr:hypothetical protein [Candidatus Pacearchaeota archaeon]|tara:strand:+ start:742 stop:1455 length:714 start_codon:yes stop_codon:yes gene_type:complete
MPNHCTNRLIASGPLPDIGALVALMQGESAFDFNKVIPIPAILQGSSSGSGEECYAIFHGDWRKAFRFLPPPGETREEAIKWAEVRYPDGKARTMADSYKAAVEATGHTSWYPWAIENWGTKWNAYDIKAPANGSPLESLARGHDEDPTTEAEWSFDTAWSPPMPIIKVLVERFPTITFTHDCIDEGGGFAYHHVWAEGNFDEPVEEAGMGGDGGTWAFTDWHHQFKCDDDDDEEDE